MFRRSKFRQLVDRKASSSHDLTSRLASLSQPIEWVNDARALPQKQANPFLKQVADSLTGLLNRMGLEEEVGSALDEQRSRRFGPTVLLSIEISKFGETQELLGYKAGDELLVKIARRLQESLRTDDILARVEGHHFAIVSRELSERKQVIGIAVRLLDAIRTPFETSDLQFVLGASIGIAYLEADSTVDKILRQASMAMRQAEKNGGDTYVIFEQSMQTRVASQYFNADELDRAISNNELVLYFQPIVDIAARKTVAVESLVRWQHPVRGLLPPSQFLPIANETGRMRALSDWCVWTSIEATSRLNLDPFNLWYCSINVINAQLQDPKFSSDLFRRLQLAGLPPSKIQLEVSESNFLDNAEQAGRLLSSLRQEGMKIALDDFGTGYSSLQYLEKFPIDTLKIDQFFIQQVAEGRFGSRLLKMIVDLAKAGEMTSCVEGIETESEHMMMLDLSCSLGQGYLYGRPQPLESVLRSNDL